MSNLVNANNLHEGELSEAESDASSIDISMKPPSPASREQLVRRMESVLQQNRVLKMEVDTLKTKVKTLQVENKQLKETSFQMQAKAEQEEEFISNTLLKKIQELKKEKEALALNYEQEEEFLTNDLTRKLSKLKQEKAELTTSLHDKQESMVSKLLRRIQKLESETYAKQQNLDQLKREKVELENTLEQEQEALVNRLWKRMENLEHEKQYLQRKLDQPATAPPSPMDLSSGVAPPLANNSSAAADHPHQSKANAAGDEERIASAGLDSNSSPLSLAKDIIRLRGEVMQLKQRLRISQTESCEKMAHITREEQQVREENCRLRHQLQMEMRCREQLRKYLSESESSLDIDLECLQSSCADDFAAAAQHKGAAGESPGGGGAAGVPMSVSPNLIRPISPATTSQGKPGPNNGNNVKSGSVRVRPMPAVGYCRCPSCGYQIQGFEPLLETQQVQFRTGGSGSKFARPVNPAPVSPRIRSESLPGSGGGNGSSNDDVSPKK